MSKPENTTLENTPTKPSDSEAVGCDELLFPKEEIIKMIGRCEALELEAKTRRDDSNGSKTVWHFNYGQEEAYRTMVNHLKDVISLR